MCFWLVYCFVDKNVANIKSDKCIAIIYFEKLCLTKIIFSICFLRLLQLLQNSLIMALEIPKIPDLWRWKFQKSPIYGVGDILKLPCYGVRGILKLPHYGVRNPKNPQFMALETS